MVAILSRPRYILNERATCPINMLIVLLYSLLLWLYIHYRLVLDSCDVYTYIIWCDFTGTGEVIIASITVKQPSQYGWIFACTLQRQIQQRAHWVHISLDHSMNLLLSSDFYTKFEIKFNASEWLLANDKIFKFQSNKSRCGTGIKCCLRLWDKHIYTCEKHTHTYIYIYINRVKNLHFECFMKKNNNNNVIHKDNPRKDLQTFCGTLRSIAMD